MSTLVHNILPAGRGAANTGSSSRPRPLDFRSYGADLMQMAAEFKAAVNSSLSLEDLTALGAERLKELHSHLTPQQRVGAAGLAAGLGLNARAAQVPRDEFAGYNLNAPDDLVAAFAAGYGDYSMNGALSEVDMLLLARDVYSLIRGAGTDTLVSLGEATLKKLKAHCEAALR